MTKNIDQLTEQYQEALIMAGIQAANYLADRLNKNDKYNNIINTNNNQDYRAELALKLLVILQQIPETKICPKSKENN